MLSLRKSQLVGLLIMGTAEGLLTANYVPPATNIESFLNYMLHFIPVILLIVGAALTSSGRTSGKVLVNVTIGLFWTFSVFAIDWSIAHPNPNAFGPHNFNDYSPIVLFTVGAILWLVCKPRSQSLI